MCLTNDRIWHLSKLVSQPRGCQTKALFRFVPEGISKTTFQCLIERLEFLAQHEYCLVDPRLAVNFIDTLSAWWDDVCGGKELQGRYGRPQVKFSDVDWSTMHTYIARYAHAFVNTTQVRTIVLGDGLTVRHK